MPLPDVIHSNQQQLKFKCETLKMQQRQAMQRHSNAKKQLSTKPDHVKHQEKDMNKNNKKSTALLAVRLTKTRVFRNFCAIAGNACSH